MMKNSEPGRAEGDILIIDDDLNYLQLLSGILVLQGYEVRGAQNGTAALSFIEKDPPDLILCDIRMPGMDGYEICERLKADEHHREIPIIFLSTLRETDDKGKGFAAGAVDFITKPFQTEEVLARVNTHLSLSGLQKELEIQIADRTKKLSENEARFRAFMENNPAHIYMKDGLGRHIYANSAMLALIKLSLEEFVGTRSSDFFAPEITDRLEALDQQVLSGNVNRITEEFNVSPLGQKIWIRDIKFPITTATGEKLLGGIALDITELKTAEDALKKQVAFERMVSDIVADLAQTDPDQMEAAIDATLEKLGRFFKTERAFLGRMTDGEKTFRFTNVWAAPGIDMTATIFDMDINHKIPWVIQQIREDRVIDAGPDLKRLPPEADALRRRLELDGINSGICVPVRVEGKPTGLLGLDTMVEPRVYSESTLGRLRIVADLIGKMIQSIQFQAALEDRINFEKLLGDISASFIGLSMYEFDQAINQVLEKIGRFLRLDRCSFGSTSPDGSEMRATHIWQPGTVTGVKKSYRLDEYPWLLSPFKTGKMLLWSRSEGMPEGSVADIRLLEESGMQVFAGVPVVVEDKVTSCFGFSSISRPEPWDTEIIARFELIARIFGNLLERLRADAKLETAYSEISVLKDRLENENVALVKEIEIRYHHKEIIGNSDAIKAVLATAEKVAPTESSVLITGETGTGKELIANTIHKLSQRSDRPMMTLNCASLPATLIESELFGREKGAYTGALSRQSGRFEAADRSTLFLDEIGEIPLEVQGKLLRVMQTGEFERLGSHKTLKSNARIITATNRDLAEMCRQGKFRKDLYYRLNVFPVHVPPLRERHEDIPLLVWAFVSEFSQNMAKQIDQIPEKTMQKLVDYFWPGNVRELQNVVERAMILSSGRMLKIDWLSPLDDGTDQVLELQAVEKKHIEKVLEMTNWRVSGKGGAAEILGLKPTTLEARMKKSGIRRPQQSRVTAKR